MKTGKWFKNGMIAFILAFCIFPGRTGAQPAPHAFVESDFAQGDIVAIRASSQPYPVPLKGVGYDPLSRYVDYYGLRLPGTVFSWGKAASRSGFDLFLFSVRPERQVGTIVFTHGFLDHAGMHSRLFRFFLENGYAVAAFDLPGHGLSSGKPGDIGEFADYGIAFEDAVEIFAASDLFGTGKVFGAAHSTGCSALVEYSYRFRGRLDGCILVAPLIRSFAWDFTKGVLPIMKMFTERFWDLSGSDYSITVNGHPATSDPLDRDDFGLSWAEALMRWDAENRTYGTIPVRTFVIQGSRDIVVDFPYNLAWLKARLDPYAEKILPDADHFLLYRDGISTVSLGDAVAESLLAALAFLSAD